MKKIFLVLFTFLFVSSLNFAELKLKLPAEITGETTSSIINKNIEQNLKLDIPVNAVPPADMREFVKGMIMLGILADVSIPMGSDDGFKHIAGTGFSGHVVGSYLVSTSFLIALRAGYINFGTQTQEGSEAGFSYKYEDTYSQIPILLGAYYLFSTNGSFKPYIGAALGVFFQTYAVNWTEEYEFGGEPFVLDESFSNTGFGVVPAVGFYMLLGSVVLQAAVEYAILFSEGPTVEYTYDPGIVSKVSGVAQEEYEEESEKPSYISVNVGVNFPLGQ